MATETDNTETDEEEAERLRREEQRVRDIRQHILAGNAFEIERALLEVDNLTTVARGFRFEPEEASLFLRQTPQRIGDPDVNAIRGFAEAILRGGDPDTLAKVFTLVLSLQGSFLSSKFTLRLNSWTVAEDRFLVNPAGTFQGLFESFSNATEMQAILDADPAAQNQSESSDGGRKLLAAGKPADTTLCAKCFEKKFCEKNAPWC